MRRLDDAMKFCLGGLALGPKDTRLSGYSSELELLLEALDRSLGRHCPLMGFLP